MDLKKIITILIFLILAFILLSYSISLYDSDNNNYVSLLDLTDQDLQMLKECAPEEADTLQQLNNLVTCEIINERKHSIMLLAAFPNDDANNIRNLYEPTTNYSTYIPYYEEDSKHTQVFDYQTGPWELYCRGKQGKCFYDNPKWEVPYLVKTVFPLYSELCSTFGYDLPTHDKVIHIAHNPVDSIYGWAGREFSGDFSVNYYINQFSEWYKFWKVYENDYSSMPVYWFRYEDICLCPKQAMQAILQVSGNKNVDENILEENIRNYFKCDIQTNLGEGIELFSLPDLKIGADYLKEYIVHFGYEELYLKMTEYHTRDNNTFSEVLIESLYPSLTLPPSEEYCSRLISNEWKWLNTLG